MTNNGEVEMKKYIFEDCELCDGTGQVSDYDLNYQDIGDGARVTTAVLNNRKQKCPICMGNGFIKTRKFLDE